MSCNSFKLIGQGSAKAIWALAGCASLVFCTAAGMGTNKNLRNEVAISRKMRDQIKILGGSTQHLAVDYKDTSTKVHGKYTVCCPRADSNLERVAQDPSVSLFQRIKFCFQAASAMSTMHAAGFLHRDLKPDNFLTFNGNTSLKVSDFGTTVEEAARLTTCSLDGNGRYAAPEGVMSKKAEVFSLGLVMIRIVEEGLLQALNKKMLMEPTSKKWGWVFKPDRGVIQYLIESSKTNVSSKTFLDIPRRIWSWIKFCFGIKTVNQHNQMALHAYIDKLNEELKAQEGFFSSGRADRLCALFKEMTYADPDLRISAQEAMNRLSQEIRPIHVRAASAVVSVPAKIYNWMFS